MILLLVDLLPRSMDLVFSLLTRKLCPLSIYLDSGDGRSRPRSVRGARSTQGVPDVLRQYLSNHHN